jgi:hypothetical protein
MKQVEFITFELVHIFLWNVVKALSKSHSFIGFLVVNNVMASCELGALYELGPNSDSCCDADPTVNHAGYWEGRVPERDTE